MGYTHYWTQPKDYSKKDWITICADVGAILKDVQHVQGIPLAWEYDTPGKQVEVSDDTIRFNGLGEDGHETFYIERTRTLEEWQTKDRLGWAFCKTARKPYDLAVTAILAYLASLEKKPWRVSSDGDGREWLEGVNLARRAVPRFANQIDIPLSIRKADRWCNWYDGPVKTNGSKRYSINACIDGAVYVYDDKDESQCYRFPTLEEATAYFAQFKEKPRKVITSWHSGPSTSREGGGPLFAAYGSFDKARHAYLDKECSRVCRELIARGPSEGRNIPPPAFARPNEMAKVAKDQEVTSLADLYQLCEAA